MPANLKIWLPLVALIVFSSWYFATEFTPVLSATSVDSQNRTTFTVDSLKTQTGSASPTDPGPRYRIYLFPGDGTFTFGTTPADGHPFVYDYTYPAGGGHYGAFAEATAEYTDGDPPPGFAQLVSPINIGSGGTSTSSIGPRNLNGMPFLITPARKVVPEHELTYVVTFENPSSSYCSDISGRIEFNFDDSKLNYLHEDQYAGYSDKYQIQQNTTGTIQWTFEHLLKGEQRSIFLRFKTETQTNGAVPGAAISPAPTVKFISPDQTGLGNCNIVSRSVVLTEHSVISAAHDPNQKTVSPAVFCIEDNGYLNFMVTFQNDGYTPVKDIRIEDELDTLLANCCSKSPVVLQEWYPRTGNMRIQQSCTNGKFTVILKDVNLRGTQQPGYGQIFSEHETKGYIKFRVPKSCLRERPPCSAVCNRATILFDCNQPLETNVAISRINCISCGTCSDTTITLPVWETAPGNLMSENPKWPAGLVNSYTHFKWYPAAGLSNPLIANPELTAKHSTTFTLVASGSTPCKRLVLHVPVVFGCGLRLDMTKVVKTVNCVPVYDLTFKTNALAHHIDTTKLEWQDCSKGAGWTKNDLTPGKYYFSVKDPVSGCYAEKWVELPDQAFKVNYDPDNYCTGGIGTTGAISPLTLVWSWYEDGNPNPFSSSQRPPTDGPAKSNIVLTITDKTNKCVSVQFNPNCTNQQGEGSNRWAIAAGVAGSLLLVWFGMRKKA